MPCEALRSMYALEGGGKLGVFKWPMPLDGVV
jgi:hypothetical protein